MKYLIMCGGQYDAFSEPKQLTKINGEPLVARTIRQLRQQGATEIWISANDMRFASFGVPMIARKNRWTVHRDETNTGYWVDAFPETDEPTCYLMGDVVFSDDAIRTIVKTQTDWIQFFASAPPFAPNYTKEWAEPFAFKVVDQKRFREAIDYCKRNRDTRVFNRHPIAWELWQVINGENPNAINYKNYVAINDYTCDLDKPEDGPEIERAMRR